MFRILQSYLVKLHAPSAVPGVSHTVAVRGGYLSPHGGGEGVTTVTIRHSRQHTGTSVAEEGYLLKFIISKVYHNVL